MCWEMTRAFPFNSGGAWPTRECCIVVREGELRPSVSVGCLPHCHGTSLWSCPQMNTSHFIWVGVWGTKFLWGVRGDGHHYLTKGVSWRARCISVKCLACTYPVGLTVPPWGLLMLRTDYVYVLSQSICAKDTEHGFIYPIDKSLLCKMRSRTVRCAKLT